MQHRLTLNKFPGRFRTLPLLLRLNCALIFSGFIVWAVPCTLSAQSPVFFWGKLDVHYKLNDRWSFDAEGMHRRRAEDGRDAFPFAHTQTNALRLWVKYQHGAHTRFWFSPVGYFSQSIALKYGEQTLTVFRPEWRWSAGAQNMLKSKHHTWSIRNLAEWRHFDVFEGLPANNRLRLRHQLDYSRAFGARWRFDVWNEYFWVVAPDAQFDQNRTGAFFSCKISPAIAAQVGYFYTWLPNPANAQHVVHAYLTFDLH